MGSTVKRFDIGQITSVERTPQGFLKVPGFATRTGVFIYMDGDGSVRRELRHPDDVFDPESLVTLKNAVVTLDHPPVMVTPENYKQYSKGYTTDRVEVNRDLVETDLIIADEEAIDAIEKQGIRELSSGYLADVEEEEGVYNGTPYNFRQKNIKYNHVALVKRGRAGPEARLRLDSADAVMQENNPVEAAGYRPEGESDSMDEKQTKAVIISGQKVELPTGIADVIQDMMDRYDQMRGELAQLKEEAMANRKDDDTAFGKKDVDVSQKGISPQVNVSQMAPDGRGASKKVGAGDQGGPARAKGLLDEEEKQGKSVADDEGEESKKDEEKEEEKKKDYEGAGMAGGAESPVDLLKHEIAEMASMLQGMKSKNDELQAKVDNYASMSMNQGEKGPQGEKMDSASIRTLIRRRVKLEKQAESLVPESISSRFDSMSDDEIRAAVISHRSPKADLAGKSSTYLQVRFDGMVEMLGQGEAIRKEMGRNLLAHLDAQTESPEAARQRMIAESRKAYQQPLSKTKAQH